MSRKWVPLNDDYGKVQRLAPKELEALTRRLRRGDRSVEHKIIESHLRLGIDIALSFNTDVDSEELVGEAELAITEADRKVSRGGVLHDNNITAYIGSYIKWYIKDYIATATKVVSIPISTLWDWNKAGKAKNLPVKIALLEDNPQSKRDDSNQEIRLKTESGRYHVPSVESDNSRVELDELLAAISNNVIERRILELRESGYKIEEIGTIVGYSKSMVSKLLGQMEERLDIFLKKG